MTENSLQTNAEDTEEFTDQSIRERIAAEAKELKAYAEAFGIQRLKDGSWFLEFIGVMLKSYSENILKNGGIEFFRKKYPGLPKDQIATKVIETAEKYAALSGGVTALGATTATLGTAGVGFAGAVGSVGVDILFTTRLQLRLVYDLSVLYGYPLDADDPEDLMRAFSIAYGVAVASAGSQVIMKAGPEVIRHQLRNLLWGNTKAIQSAAKKIIGPKLGEKITNRALMKGLVPGVSIVVSSGWNYVATKRIAAIAQHELRTQARIRDAVRELAEVLKSRMEYAPLVLESVVAVATAEGDFSPHEGELFKTVVNYLELPLETLRKAEEQVDVSTETIVNKLRAVTDESFKRGLVECLVVVAAADGEVHRDEELLLFRIFTAAGLDFDKEALYSSAKSFKRPLIFMDSAGEAIGATAEKVKASMANIGSGMRAFFTKATPEAEETMAAEPVAAKGFDPITEIKKLAELHSSGILTSEEFDAKKRELLARI